MAALGLTAGIGAGCQDDSETTPPNPTVTEKVILIYRVDNGKTSTCVRDRNGERCSPGYIPGYVP
jgi:hypothetical protein